MTQTTMQFEPKTKMSRQCQLIVELFKRQDMRATNVDLAEIALSYTRRLSDLKLKHGYDIPIVERRKHGVNVYELVMP